MAFVAEYISKEDLEEYDIIDIINKIRTKFRKPLLSDQDIRWLNWVVDKQKQTYLNCRIHEMAIRARIFGCFIIKVKISSLI